MGRLGQKEGGPFSPGHSFLMNTECRLLSLCPRRVSRESPLCLLKAINLLYVNVFSLP